MGSWVEGLSRNIPGREPGNRHCCGNHLPTCLPAPAPWLNTPSSLLHTASIYQLTSRFTRQDPCLLSLNPSPACCHHPACPAGSPSCGSRSTHMHVLLNPCSQPHQQNQPHQHTHRHTDTPRHTHTVYFSLSGKSLTELA